MYKFFERTNLSSILYKTCELLALVLYTNLNFSDTEVVLTARLEVNGKLGNGKVGNGKLSKENWATGKFGNGKFGNNFFGGVGKVGNGKIGNGKLGNGNPGNEKLGIAYCVSKMLLIVM